MLKTEIGGVTQLLKSMEGLPASIQRNALSAGLKAGGTVIKKQAVQNLKAVQSPEATGFGARNIIVKKIKSKKKAILHYIVAVRGQILSPSGQRPGLYLSVLEYGKEGQPPRPWLRPAGVEKAAAVVAKVAEVGKQNMIRAVEAARKKGRL